MLCGARGAGSVMMRSRDGPCPLVGDLKHVVQGVVGPDPLHTHSGQVPGHRGQEATGHTRPSMIGEQVPGASQGGGPGTKVTGHS